MNLFQAAGFQRSPFATLGFLFDMFWGLKGLGSLVAPFWHLPPAGFRCCVSPLICFGVGASVQTDSFETQVQGLLSDLVDWLPEWWEHVRRCSDGFLLDVVRSEVSGLIPHLFGCCLKGGSTWEASIAEFLERQLASNGFLLDVVGSEGQVARGRGRASFGTVPRLVSHLFRW